MMANHISTGKAGEAMAVEYLSEKGYEILHKNWRHKHWEVDVIASKGDILHMVEVKTKRNDKYGYPEDAVTRRKIKYLLCAAEAYLFTHPQWQKIQLDIISIVLEPHLQILLIEDVFL